MALEQITQSIIAEARKEADTLTAAATQEVATIEHQWAHKIAEEKKRLLHGARTKAQRKVQQTVFASKAEAQATVLEKQQKALAKVSKAALEQLGQLSDAQYTDLMVKLVQQLPTDASLELQSASGKEALLKKAITKSNSKMKLSPDTIKSIGGFIATSDQLDIDNRFEVLVAKAFDSMHADVARQLFGTT